MTLQEALKSDQPYKEESELLRKLKDWLEIQPGIKVLRISDRYAKGYSDIFCCVNGVFVALELKDDVGTPSPHQIQFIADIKAAKGEAGVCRTIREAALIIVEAQRRAAIMNGENSLDK